MPRVSLRVIPTYGKPRLSHDEPIPVRTVGALGNAPALHRTKSHLCDPAFMELILA